MDQFEIIKNLAQNAKASQFTSEAASDLRATEMIAKKRTKECTQYLEGLTNILNNSTKEKVNIWKLLTPELQLPQKESVPQPLYRTKLNPPELPKESSSKFDILEKIWTGIKDVIFAICGATILLTIFYSVMN